MGKIKITEEQLNKLNFLILTEQDNITLPRNFEEIPGGDNNWRSSQPSLTQLEYIINTEGIENVVRMNADTDSGGVSKADEKELVEGMGVNYYWVNAHKYNSGDKDKGIGYTKSMEEVLPILEEGNTLIHCTAGMDRTGYMVAKYLQDNFNWDKDKLWDYTVGFNKWENHICDNVSNKGYIKYMEAFYSLEEWCETYDTEGNCKNCRDIVYDKKKKNNNTPTIRVPSGGSKSNDFEKDLDGKLIKRWGKNTKKFVERIQKMLFLLGYDLGIHGVDGKFGTDTEKAVKEFQKDVFTDKEEWDGIVGPITYEELIVDIDNLASEENIGREDLIDSVDDEDLIDSVDDEDKPDISVETTYDDSDMGFPTGGADSGKAMVGGLNGDWDGSMPRALALARMAKDYFNVSISSQKRSGKNTSGGNVSQHWVGSTKSYAVDLHVPDVSPGTPKDSKGDLLWDAIVDYLGKPGLSSGKWQNVFFEGYRYNIGWRVSQHYNHIHVGVKKGSTTSTKPSENTKVIVGTKLTPSNFKNTYGQNMVNATKGTPLFPSVKLAQAALETGWGKHTIGDANNMFGIKAYGSPNEYWDGSYVSADSPEEYDGKRDIHNSKFRKYKSLEDSILDHSRLLMTSGRYQPVRDAKTADEQAKALKEAGYATGSEYANKLILIMNKYGFKELDDIV